MMKRQNLVARLELIRPVLDLLVVADEFLVVESCYSVSREVWGPSGRRFTDHLKTEQSSVFSRGGSAPPNRPGILGGLCPPNSPGFRFAVGGDR